MEPQKLETESPGRKYSAIARLRRGVAAGLISDIAPSVSQEMLMEVLAPENPELRMKREMMQTEVATGKEKLEQSRQMFPLEKEAAGKRMEDIQAQIEERKALALHHKALADARQEDPELFAAASKIALSTALSDPVKRMTGQIEPDNIVATTVGLYHILRAAKAQPQPGKPTVVPGQAPAAPPQPQKKPRAKVPVTPQPSGTIRVREKATGKTGTLKESDFDSARYERL